MKRALITGGSGAIGAAISRRLARDGFAVIVHANRNPAAAEALCAQLCAEGLSASAVQFDVADAAASQAALEALLEQGPIQVIVNNAGIHDDAVFPGMRPEQWHRVIDVSLHGFFNVTQPLTMPMIRTRWGRIVNITSVAALAGNRGQTNYAAAKAGVMAASKSLAIELAKRDITVNCVAPGLIDTEMVDAHVLEEAMKLIPARRMGRPEEVAALVAFLMSDDAAYITRQVISVNGGML